MPSLQELNENTPPAPIVQQSRTPSVSNAGNDVFSFILSGLKERPNTGNRNNFIHVFSSECNRFGVSKNECFQYCLQWKEKDFQSYEIERTINSSYSRKNEHGTKTYKPIEHRERQKTPTPATNPGATAKDYDNLLLKTELDYSHPPDRPPTALKINGQIISTLGNFCAVIGKAKSRKTFFLTSIAAAALKGECLNVTSELPENKRKVLVFDTEQGKYHVYKTFDRIRSQAGNNNNLHIFQLRELATADRVQVIEEALVKLPNVGLVIIDGLRDLISDINSQEQATMINDKLLQWTSKFNIAIFIVIHQNKADSNARGHVGTEIVNKSETVLSVEKNSKNIDVSTVRAEYCRNMDFEPFSFLINDAGLPELTEFEYEATGRRSLLADSIDNDTHLKILQGIFEGGKELKYSDFQEAITTEFKKYGHSIGKNKSRDFIKFYDQQEFLERSGYPGTKMSTYKLKDGLPF